MRYPLRSLLRRRRRGQLLQRLDRIASALERIASAQESQLPRRGFRSSLPTPADLDDADFLSQSDEDFAFLDQLEEHRRRAGREVGLEEDLEDEYAGLPRGEEE